MLYLSYCVLCINCHDVQINQTQLFYFLIIYQFDNNNGYFICIEKIIMFSLSFNLFNATVK